MSFKSVDPGLCKHCLHHRALDSSKGSRFWLCTRSAVNPALPKYPRLPVLQCPGHQPTDRPSQASDATEKPST